MYTDSEFDRLLKAAAAGSVKARQLLDLDAAAVAEAAMERQIVRNRLTTLGGTVPAGAGSRGLQLVLEDQSRNPDLLAVA